jgi:hypothetical protein
MYDGFFVVPPMNPDVAEITPGRSS